MKKVHIITMMVLTVFLNLMMVSSVLAEGGNGSGGGQQNPLALVSSDPVDGQKDVKLPVEIKLTFNKNVVNMTVKDTNNKGFTLSSADGQVIPIDVIMADDQMEPEKNQEVRLKPLQDLKSGTAYKVMIAPEVKSKSGVTLGKQTVINFVTAGSNSSSAVEKPSQVTSSQTNTGNPVDTDKNNGGWNKGILLGSGVVILILAGVLIYIKRKR